MARNRHASGTDVAEAENPTPDAEATAQETPKAARTPVNVGEVTIAPSSAESLPARESKLDTEPLAVAVRDAEQGKVYDVLVDADKVKAAESILVRAGARHGVGVNKRVVHTDEPREDGKVLLQFTTGARRVRKAKPTDNATPEAPSVEPTPEHDATGEHIEESAPELQFQDASF